MGVANTSIILCGCIDKVTLVPMTEKSLRRRRSVGCECMYEYGESGIRGGGDGGRRRKKVWDQPD